MEKRDYYEVLGVAKTATADELKKAYHKKAIQYHPDRQQDKSEAEKKLFGIPTDEQVYAAAKQALSIYQFDNDKVKLEPGKDGDRYKAMLTISSGWGRSFYYLHDNEYGSDISKWEPGTFFVMDDSRSRKPVEINFKTRQEAEDFLEKFAKMAQDKANSCEGKSKENTSKRKGPFVPPQLRNIHRTGPDYRHGHKAQSEMFLSELNFRGGEFGNWLNDNDRQASLDMAYDALRDLARVLEIKPEDVALDNKLAIAFGARGVGGAKAARAHYEPGRQVINLTKMSGAGCLAHEWAHALDHAIGIAGGAIGLASEAPKCNIPDSFKDLLSSMRYKEVTFSNGEVPPDVKERTERAHKNLIGWIKSVKPSRMPEDMEKAWNLMSQNILESVSTFTGAEYVKYRRNDSVLTKPEVEILSQLRKEVSGHGIPKDAKRNICFWAAEINRLQEETKSKEPVVRRVKTDFYKGSIAFDDIHSRAGHGYWQSQCEMFARAFDCYIADKFKDAGLKSQYLSAYADSFVSVDTTGEKVAAIPQGEERKLLNEKFDILISDLKERGILHAHIEELEEEKPLPSIVSRSAREDSIVNEIPSKPEHFEQMSFEDLLFNAEQRTKPVASKSGPPRGKSRE